MSNEDQRFPLTHEKRLTLDMDGIAALIKQYLLLTGAISQAEADAGIIEPDFHAENDWDDPTFTGVTFRIDMSRIQPSSEPKP